MNLYSSLLSVSLFPPQFVGQFQWIENYRLVCVSFSQHFKSLPSLFLPLFLMRSYLQLLYRCSSVGSVFFIFLCLLSRSCLNFLQLTFELLKYIFLIFILRGVLLASSISDFVFVINCVKLSAIMLSNTLSLHFFFSFQYFSYLCATHFKIFPQFLDALFPYILFYPCIVI